MYITCDGCEAITSVNCVEADLWVTNILICHILELVFRCDLLDVDDDWIIMKAQVLKIYCFSGNCINGVVSDISFSDAHSGDQEKIEGPRGDDHAVYRDSSRGKKPPRLHPQANCFDHPRR